MKKLVIVTLLLCTCKTWSFSTKSSTSPIGGTSTSQPKGGSGPVIESIQYYF